MSTGGSGGGRIDVRDRNLVGIIGDQDTVTGMLLAGIGMVDSRHKKNFYVADAKTELKNIEDAFRDLSSRRDLAILLITQHIADRIRHILDGYSQLMPALLEIPSKDHPYDPEKDSILKRVTKIYGKE